MTFLKIPDSDLISIAKQTTLGMEAEAFERTGKPDIKPLKICLILLGVAFLLSRAVYPSGETAFPTSVTVILVVIGIFYGGRWINQKIEYNKKVNRYKWILWLFECVGMVFHGELQDLKNHLARGTGNYNDNVLSLKQTCIEIIGGHSPCDQPCAILRRLTFFDSLFLVNNALTSLGDNTLSAQASKANQLIELLERYGMNGNCIADSTHYGQAKQNCVGDLSSTNETMLLNDICTLEAQCTDTTNGKMPIIQLDAEKILNVLYRAALAKPPVSQDTFERAQGLSEIAFGTDDEHDDVLPPDAMLAHLIRCKCLSSDRVNREINETRKRFEVFIQMHDGDPDFYPKQFIYSFCGALKVLQLYNHEKACLETAEKYIGALDTELTARLDYLSRGGGRQNSKVKYYSGTKRTDTLPVDYDAIRMNTSDVEWLFNEVLGNGGNNAYIDYALAYRVQVKKAALPSAQIQIQGKSIADEILAKLGAEAKVSKAMVTVLNSNETLQCLKIRTSRFPFIAYFLDISTQAQQVQIRLAVCWIPISNVYDQQKQQCLSFWSRGTGEEMVYMDRIFSAIENAIQRLIDKWNTSHTNTQPAQQSKQGTVYY